MIELTRFGDVTRARMWTRRSAAVGYDVSAYLVRDTIIDTGFRHVSREFTQFADARQPRGIVVTHWHEDHAGNAPTLAARWPMWMAQYTERKLRERQQVKFYRHFTWGRPKKLESVVTAFDVSPLQIIAAPGHSPDHHVVFDAETRTLFSADLWLGVKVRIVGATENPYEIIDSLSRVIALEPVRMFDAHRGFIDQPVLALEAKRAWLQNTVRQIERRLDAGDQEHVILKSVLGGEERTALVSQGEYSRRNLVRSIARYRGQHTATIGA
jgi:glyoxylase-like metal-dependent hydrolase (beta-lactamase superfamily II)